jgi:Flp pilus assembly pilin Flp
MKTKFVTQVVNADSSPSNYDPPCRICSKPRRRLSLIFPNAKSCNDDMNVLNKRKVVAVTALKRFWREDEGQDIAEYAVMLAVILVLVVGTIRLVGSSANNTFSSVSSSLQ